LDLKIPDLPYFIDADLGLSFKANSNETADEMIRERQYFVERIKNGRIQRETV
jgi:hypothetical protein